MPFEIQNLGTVIKRLRLEQKKTIEMLAKECGFSKSLLSKIENAKVIPTMGTLSKISHSLNIKMSTLFEDDGSSKAIFTGSEILAKKTKSTKAGYSMLPIATDFKDKKMQPFIVSAEKGKVDMKDLSHEGQELVFIIEGSMEFKVGNDVYKMEKGDSLYFDSLEKHSILPTSKKLRYLNIIIE